jgi:hypothetical protein
LETTHTYSFTLIDGRFFVDIEPALPGLVEKPSGATVREALDAALLAVDRASYREYMAATDAAAPQSERRGAGSQSLPAARTAHQMPL